MKENVLEDVQALVQFARNVRKNSKFNVDVITLSDQSDWKFNNSFLSHKTNGFFHVAGYKDFRNEQEKLVFYQPQGAFNGLIIHRKHDDAFALVHARVEPGNCGVVQYGPTIQSTPANYLRLHQGKVTPYLNYFFGVEPNSKPVYQSTQLDLGERYFLKSKVLSYVETEMFVPSENMAWVSIKVLKELAFLDHLVNTDLRSMLGVFDWDFYIYEETSRENDFYNNLKFEKGQPKLKNGSLVNLSKLRSWEVDDYGISSTGPDQIEVKMFRTSCFGREVRQWDQPLMCVRSSGQVVLLTTQIRGVDVFAITLGDEFGIPGRQVFLPSFVRYPGVEFTSDFEDGEIVNSLEQSEEGGRFYQNVNRYQIRKVPENYELKSNQKWITANELKGLLSTSNQVSIQLRCFGSMLIEELNSRLF